MKITIISYILIFILSNCNSDKPYLCNCNTTYLHQNDSVVNHFLSDNSFFIHQYEQFKIKPLHFHNNESYRLNMSHSFSRYTQIYTISKTTYGASMDVIQYYDDKEKGLFLNKHYNVVLTNVQWNTIKDKIETTCYWSNEIGADKCQTCLDGGTWILEGFDPEKRNCANRSFNIDECDFYSTNDLGNLCRTIRKFAREEHLNIYEEWK